MSNKGMKALEHLLNRMVSEDRLDVENRGKLAKALKKLSRALSARNYKGVEKTIGEISEILIEINRSRP